MSWALKRSFGVNQTGFAKFGNNGNLKPRHIWDDLQYVFSCFFYTFPSSFFLGYGDIWGMSKPLRVIGFYESLHFFGGVHFLQTNSELHENLWRFIEFASKLCLFGDLAAWFPAPLLKTDHSPHKKMEKNTSGNRTSSHLSCSFWQCFIMVQRISHHSPMMFPSSNFHQHLPGVPEDAQWLSGKIRKNHRKPG
jgi:hypothetical protein